MRLKEVKDTSEGRKYVGDPNPERFAVLKQGSLKQKDLSKMRFWTRDGANCGCGMLEPGRENFLVMGHRDGKKLYMTYVHIWAKTREFRNAVRQFGQPCPVSGGGDGATSSSESPATRKPRKDRGQGGKNGRPGRLEDPGQDDVAETTTQLTATERKLTREERRQLREQMRETKRENRRNKE